MQKQKQTRSTKIIHLLLLINSLHLLIQNKQQSQANEDKKH